MFIDTAPQTNPNSNTRQLVAMLTRGVDRLVGLFREPAARDVAELDRRDLADLNLRRAPFRSVDPREGRIW